MLKKLFSKMVVSLDEKISGYIIKTQEDVMIRHVLEKLFSGKPLQVKDMHEMKYSQIDMLATCEALERLDFIKKYKSQAIINGKSDVSPSWQITTKGISYFGEINKGK